MKLRDRLVGMPVWVMVALCLALTLLATLALWLVAGIAGRRAASAIAAIPMG